MVQFAGRHGWAKVALSVRAEELVLGRILDFNLFVVSARPLFVCRRQNIMSAEQTIDFHMPIHRLFGALAE